MGNLIDDTWPIEHEFTVCFKVKEFGAAGHFIKAMNEHDKLFYGCEIQRVDIRDSAGEYKDKVENIKKLLLEIGEI